MVFDKWTIIALVIFGIIALNVVVLIFIVLFKIIRNIYIALRYGIKHTDQEDI